MINKSINIYGHYGSNNHGNEAIVRGACELFADFNINLYSFIPESDYKFNLDELVNIKPIKNELPRYSFKNLIGKFLFVISKSDIYREKLRYKSFFEQVKPNDIFLLEAGDQFFENNELVQLYDWINMNLKQRSAKLVFFLGSIPVNKINSLLSSLNMFDLVIARESISYECLMQTNLKDKVLFSPCCAFLMPPKDIPLGTIFNQKVIGITYGYLTQSKEKYNKLLMSNTINLINYIINETEYNVALIPHVNVASELSDYKFFKDILTNNDFSKQRVQLIDENSANIQKKIISECELYLTVRTHVSIAAYSSFVPTVVLSYSQKSLGIATDLFGSTENYTVDINQLNDDICLINSFKWLVENKDNQKKYLQSIMTDYLVPLEQVRIKIESMGKE